MQSPCRRAEDIVVCIAYRTATPWINLALALVWSRPVSRCGTNATNLISRLDPGIVLAAIPKEDQKPRGHVPQV